ncbi:hypothetical protein Ahy_B08g089656 isoform C [Arachis hypogaea]|uniref:Large ribosomal subunit protein bL28c n=1 Tax=Arachis hypogaea TaxID=3818 RepID=A0A444XYG7_ARAHY|nr:hypothetical protein Ahy_B08g089656 isoform C [Arachis hypogaea]
MLITHLSPLFLKLTESHSLTAGVALDLSRLRYLASLAAAFLPSLHRKQKQTEPVSGPSGGGRCRLFASAVNASFAVRRVCPFTGKKANKANKVSFSNHKTKKLQFVNLQYKRIWWEAGKRYVKLRLSTKALKTIEKNGLDAVAKKAGIDLRKK